MTHRSIAHSAVALFAALSLAACHKSPSTAATPAAGTNGSSSTAAAKASNALPAGVTLAMVVEGDTLFHARSCKNCHGADAKGAKNGPDLTAGHFLHANGTYEDFIRIITNGLPKDSIKVASHPFAMAPRGGARPAPLTDTEIRSVAAYVYSLNHR